MSAHKKNKHESRSPRDKTDWFGVVVPLLISFALSIIIINNDSPIVLIGAWFGLALAIGWSFVKLFKPFPWTWWKKTAAVGLLPFVISCLAYGNIRERLRSSFVFIIPGVVVDGDTWDFIVNHRGPKTSYNAQILFSDEDRRDYLQRTKQNSTAQDLNSYQVLLSVYEMNPRGRESIFAKQFKWRPFTLANSHFTAEITWRDGGAHEEIRIARVQNEWKYAISVRDKETGKTLLHCKDDGFPAGESLPACFPGINSSN